MPERRELPLKILCWALMVLVLYRLVLVLAHINPLYHLKIPALPTLPATSTASASGATTNSAGSTKTATNAPRQQVVAATTNSAARSTNLVARSTNRVDQAANAPLRATNFVANGTNLVAQSTNAAPATNSLAGTSNTPPVFTAGSFGPPSLRAGPPRPGMPGGPMPGMAKPGPELPPEMQARIDRVIDSEILGPVMRPLPMALLGIAGESVFLRAPNGQTGLIKTGEELGGVKLLRVGINRVLVQEQGDQKELTIFAGLGGESLLSTQKDSPK